jgi:hypothetical protein
MIWLLAALSALGQPAPLVHGVAYPDIMPVSKIRPGMRGYGLTVFRGTRIERFDVTVVAVVRNGSLVAPGHDMILIRMAGGPMSGRGAYLIRGMSGSPIYVNGKCVGAFSQGEPTTKEPLGGVTPITDMLEAWDPKLPSKAEAWMRGLPSLGGRRVTLARPLDVGGGRRIRRIVFDARGSAGAPRDTLVLKPCTAMVTFAGIPGAYRKRLAEMLEPFGVEVMQIPAGRSDVSMKGGSLTPGAAVSTMLMVGDVETGATGTVTYRRGNRLLAFGHPFLGVGPLNAPVCSATIHDVYPLNSGSYKIATPGPVLGSTDQDRLFGISATAGRLPDMIPITVDVSDRTTGRSRVYHMRAVRHPNLYAGLVSLAVGSAVADMHGTPGPVMAQVETVVEADQIGRIERRNRAFDARAIDMAVTTDVDAILSVLSNNPFQPLGIKSASVKVVIEPGHETATIERVFVKSSRYEPGSKLEVGVVLRPYQRPLETHMVPITIPDTVASGPLTLTVRGGGAPASVSIGGLVFRPSSAPPVEQSPPTSVRQMLDRLLEREAGDEVGLRLSLPTTSVTVDGRMLTGLPPTLDAALRSPRVAGTRTDRDEVRATLRTEWVVTGQQTLTVNVQRDRPSAASGGSPSSPSGTGSESSPSAALRSTSVADFSVVQGRHNGARPQAPSRQKATVSKEVQSKKTATEVQPPAPPAEKREAAAEKPVAKVPQVWRQTARADWARAERDGLGISSDGSAVLARKFRRLCSVPASVVWSLVSDGAGGVFAGVGPEALVCHVDSTGKTSVEATLPEVSVHALARMPDGTLYAGTAPEGRTYRIRPGSPPEVVHDAEEPYVLALTAGPDGSIFIGTGGAGGSVYRVAPDGTVTVMAHHLDRHVLALAVEPDGCLAVGTSGRGMVVRIREAGKPVVVLDAPAQSIAAVVSLPDGSLMASSAPKAGLYHIEPNASWRSVPLDTPAPIVALCADAHGTIIGGGGAWIGQWKDPAQRRPFDVPGATEVLCVAAGADGAVWAGTANAGDILVADAGAEPGSGWVVSSVFDAGTVARWGSLQWSGKTPGSSRIIVHTRSGECAEPDATWSDWASLRSADSGGQITSPEARYLQYRITMEANGAGEGPSVRDVSVSYLARNRPPSITLQSPAGGERWSGTQTLRWQASDPDGDTLSYDVQMSRDGNTWEPVPAAAAGASSAGRDAEPTAKTSPPAAQSRRPLTVAQVTAELDRHPGLPAAMREAILERTRKLNEEYAQGAPSGQPAAPAVPPASTRETQRSVDTTKVPDGDWWFRVVASDRPSNWDGAETASVISERVTICNSAPVIYVLGGKADLLPSKAARVEIVAVQGVAPLTAAQWRVDGGEWVAARPTDGMADSTLEGFTFDTDVLAAGKHTIEVRVYNACGVSASEKVAVEIP